MQFGLQACSVPQGSVLGPLKLIGYTEELADLIHSHHSATIYMQTTTSTSTTMAHAELTVDRLQQYVAEIQQWCSSRRLQMNLPLATDRRANRVQFISTDAPSSYRMSSILSAKLRHRISRRPRQRSTSSQQYER